MRCSTGAQRGGAVHPSSVTPHRHPRQALLQGGFVQRSPSPWEGREEQPHLPHASSALPCAAQQQRLLSSSLPGTGCIPVPLVPRRSSRVGCWQSSCLQGSCTAWRRGWVLWAGGLFAGSFLDTEFFLWRSLELSAVQLLGISTLQLGQGPVTQSTSSGVGQEGCSRNGLRG